jgi:hypothetical protein
MAKFLMTELVDIAEVVTARLGGTPIAGNANGLSDKDVGKFVRLAAESRYDMCAAGNEIEGRVAACEAAPQDGITIGSVMTEGRFAVTFDGLQATPGTGVVAIGDYVVCGTIVAKGTSLGLTPAKVGKATAAGNTLNFKWRVVSLGSAGTGAVGTTGVIEFIG